MKTITIDRVLYNIQEAFTPEDHEANGHFNLAREMRLHKQALDLYLIRPRGKKTYIATQFLNGNFSTVTSLPWV